MPLNTETNTPTMASRIESAASELLGITRFSSDFEHGQWWITDLDTGAQWSVCDAAGGGSVDGFCFEQVSEGSDS